MIDPVRWRHSQLTLNEVSNDTQTVGTIETARLTVAESVEAITRGLAWQDAEALARTFGVSLDRLAALVDIPPATFYRRKGTRKFTKQESDRLVRFARLWWLACDVFEGEEGARSWLKAPQFGLEGAVPLEYAFTEAGARAVEELLHRIDRGVLA
jgi:putative toxin-antitoxin system antitoxin component (TIGR02293 family)